MPRIVFNIVCAVFIAIGFAACADSAHQKHEPQDPPDYKGVPTDMTPPSMVPDPSKPQ
ncbi:hypothetical protein [Caballeronia novacaledonica]|uniref:Lipoprotein n=1 Tax=Caballeronia novacaledonica TaxID=1544861 RepID=A0AA37IGT3_9BURK|nr:hypothetical protein [Caballeronia novacaledonica]GJH28464.1 hypothetical protein CBA19CS42_28130 [Caballeronia novacaledonica]